MYEMHPALFLKTGCYKQTHKIHETTKELEHMFVILQFVVDYIVTKLSPFG
jgi:hypothetical protein